MKTPTPSDREEEKKYNAEEITKMIMELAARNGIDIVINPHVNKAMLILPKSEFGFLLDNKTSK